ncbi:bacterial transcriptional activator domain-containing protein, partial [Actinomadura kijaniata]|uniref:bacterial transcriptional activator domain-containing protein n=1 Tax=Actinomadura kijaniata TaxID=46161 RepID=UPI003F1DC83C
MKLTAFESEPAEHQAAVVEAACWLVLHPQPDATQLAADLRLTLDSERQAMLSHLRQQVLTDVDPEPHLPSDHPAVLTQMAQALTSDWQTFQQRAHTALDRLADDVPGGLHQLAQTLAAVHGEPLLSTPPWPWAAEFRRQIAEVIGKLAHTAATAALDRGSLPLAWQLAQQGLLAAPHHQQLMRDLLTIAQRSTNPSRIATTLDWVHLAAKRRGLTLEPATIALIDQLTPARQAPPAIESKSAEPASSQTTAPPPAPTS